MQIVVSEDTPQSTFVRITGTDDEMDAIIQEKDKLQGQGYRVVGDLVLDLELQERTFFMERKK
ncbi:MAG: hypothetical protein AAFU64_00035 [Bacteroidota bacterium]